MRHLYQTLPILLTACFASVTSAEPTLGGPILTLPNPTFEDFHYTSGLTHVDDVGFLRVPSGLYRFEEPLSSASVLTKVTNIGDGTRIPMTISVADDVVYAYIPEDASSTTVLDDCTYASYDKGETWVDITDKFKIKVIRDNGNEMEMTAPPYSVTKDNGIVYGKLACEDLALFYHDPKADTWTSLYGSNIVKESANGHKWDMHNGVVVAGEEGMALDFVTIARAVIAKDGKSWVVEPYSFASTSKGTLPSATGYRIFKANPSTGTFLIGEEGGILRMTKAATKLEYVVSYKEGDLPVGDNVVTAPLGMVRKDPSGYPYVDSLLYPSICGQYALAGGFDKTKPQSYLALSEDDGKTWTNISQLVDEYDGGDTGESGNEGSGVLFINEDVDGRIILGVTNPDNSTLTLVELKLPNPYAKFDPSTKDVGNGWQESATLGRVYTASYPKIWVEAHQQWWYVCDSMADSAFIYDEQMAWIWTSDKYYPWLWYYDLGHWVCYVGYGDGKRWFYDEKTNGYFSL